MSDSMEDQQICGHKVDDFFRKIKQFHNWAAPGLVLGGFMVDWALELIGPGVEADAVVESRHCLPDAVQIFTPCTVGNGWLKVLDWDKFALSLYDRHDRNGFRVWLDLEKAAAFPNLYNWYMRKVPKKSLPLEVLNKTILEAGKRPLSMHSIRMKDLYQRDKKGDIAVCPDCREAYPVRQGNVCRSCAGHAYYQYSERHGNENG